MARHPVGDATEDECAHRVAPVACHHHEIGGGSGRDDQLCRATESHHSVNLPSLAPQGFGDAIEVRLAISFGGTERGLVDHFGFDGE
jgi:hypothetical protein